MRGWMKDYLKYSSVSSGKATLPGETSHDLLFPRDHGAARRDHGAARRATRIRAYMRSVLFNPRGCSCLKCAQSVITDNMISNGIKLTCADYDWYHMLQKPSEGLLSKTALARFRSTVPAEPYSVILVLFWRGAIHRSTVPAEPYSGTVLRLRSRNCTPDMVF